MSDSPPVAAITGANGLVGGIASDALAEAGWRIRRLVRQPAPGSDDRRYTLADGCVAPDLADVDVLVHCAYDLKQTSRRTVWEANVLGTRRLLDLAAEIGVRRTLLVSSMSAYPGTRQLYGRAKLASELDAFRHRMSAIRLGLVYGPRWGGMAGALKRLVAAPVVPVVGSRSHQFTVHEADLAQAFVTLAQADDVPSVPLGLAHPTPVPFEKLLRGFAVPDRRPIFVSVPWRPVYAAMRAAELARIPLPLRSDSLLGLVRPAPAVPGNDELRAMGLRFRPFSPGQP